MMVFFLNVTCFFFIFAFSYFLQAVAGYFDIFFEKDCHNKVCGVMDIKNDLER